ncbi:MAG: tRNA lysidine(34) synthetase TilS, partial [Sodalis sp. (in: enterobacteria)]
YSSNNTDRASRRSAPMFILRAPLSGERVSVRFGPVHGLLYIMWRRHGRTLKKIWQELDILPWRRNHIPFISDNSAKVLSINCSR